MIKTRQWFCVLMVLMSFSIFAVGAASAVSLDEIKNYRPQVVNYHYDNGSLNFNFSINHTFTLDAGNPASVFNVGNSTNILLDFFLPKGEKGSPGINGTSSTFSGFGKSSYYPIISGSDTVVSFTTPGTQYYIVPAGVTSLQYLIVGGGGGGGNQAGGGGGGGGVKNGTFSVTPGQNLTILVGAKGVGSTNAAQKGSNGGSSSINSTQADGGGGGGSVNSAAGADGGSGGGARSNSNTNGGSGSVNQGNKGGAASGTNGAGGGGGGSEVGQDGQTSYNGGKGGDGMPSSITGISQKYGSGAGGGDNAANGGGDAGSLSGGGLGGHGVRTNGESAASNTGGGGGGAGDNNNGGDGGSGIVIVKYSGSTASNLFTIAHGFGSTPTYALATTSVTNETVAVTSLNETSMVISVTKKDGSAGSNQTIYWVVA